MCIVLFVECSMDTYGAPSWFYREIKEFEKQMVVHELLPGQCCDDLFTIVAVSCIRMLVI